MLLEVMKNMNFGAFSLSFRIIGRKISVVHFAG